MTPLGHLAVSYSLAKGAPVRAAALPYATSALIVGGLAPDIDFLLLGLPNFNTLHRSLTHNLFFVLAVAALCILFVHFRRVDYGAGAAANISSGTVFLVTVFLSAVTGGLSHLFLDAILDSNASNGVGVAALWPLSERFFSPFNLARLSCPGWEQPFKAVLCNVPLVLWEVPCYLLATFLWWRTVGRTADQTAGQKAPEEPARASQVNR